MSFSSQGAVALAPDALARLEYAPLPGVHDEMSLPDGTLRPGWGAVAQWFASADRSQQTARAKRADQLLFDNFSDPQDADRPWHLNLAPLVISPQEWQTIEAATIQRMRLYNAVLRDLYGGQKLFTDGALPPALVLDDPSYLRPLHGVQPDGEHLTFLALDFAREPGGAWRIIDAHAETPAGHGFVLANRMVIAEVAGGLFRSTRSRRIGQFYQALTDDLFERTQVDDPRIAILTSSPGNAAFLGHAYMARYLGHLRVEGSDLRVIGDQVFLKTIDGLKRIDMLVRAVEGRRSDPIELAPDGFDGPVGLVQACRRNPGLVTNTLGAALVENRALSPFLQRICSHLLGEDLLVPDAVGLWLGEHGVRQDVIAKIDNYVIRDAHEKTGSPGQATAGRSAAQLDAAGREALIRDIELHGTRLVAEEPTGFATAPTWTSRGLRPEPFAVRIFAALINGTPTVMPGGVALSVDENVAVALSSREPRSRDVWVVGREQAEPTISLQRMARENTIVQRHARDTQSRVADNMFWLGRYVERADATLRIVRQTLFQSAADLAPLRSDAPRTTTLTYLLEKGETPNASPSPADAMPDGDVAEAIATLCTAPERLYGLPNTIESVRRAAFQCRDRLSLDSWRILSGLNTHDLTCTADMLRLPYLATREPGRSGIAEASPAQRQAGADPEPSTDLEDVHTTTLDLIDATGALLSKLAAFSGMSHENMTRNRGWYFLDMGRRIERASQLSELLLALFTDDAADDGRGEDLTFALYVADSYLTYRSRYRFAPDLKPVLDLLLIDETNPRSLAYQLTLLGDHIGHLPKSTDDAVRAPDQRLALDLLTRVRLADLDDLITPGAGRPNAGLVDLLESVARDLPHLSEVITRQYFSLADEQPQRLHPRYKR